MPQIAIIKIQWKCLKVVIFYEIKKDKNRLFFSKIKKFNNNNSSSNNSNNIKIKLINSKWLMILKSMMSN